MQYRISALFTITLFLLLGTSTGFAKLLALYDQPLENAKIVGKIDSEAGIVPIFTTKAGDWIKVGDPKNGNVGWIKSDELSSTSPTTSGFTFTQRFVNDGKGPQSYVVQFGTPKPLTSEQTKAMMKQMEDLQMQIQKEMQRMMNGVLGQQWTISPAFILPIVVVPTPVKNSPDKSPQPPTPKK